MNFLVVKDAGKTPASCGIKIEGKNKWITLIQNATKEGFIQARITWMGFAI